MPTRGELAYASALIFILVALIFALALDLI